MLFTCIKSCFFRNHLANFHQISHWSFCWNVTDSLFKWSCSIDCQAHIFFFKTKNCSNDDIFISCDDRIGKMLHNICMSAVAMSLRWANRGPWASCLEYLFSYRMEFVQIKRRVHGKSRSFWWCKHYSAIWSNSREHSKNVFAVNLGHRNNVHEIWRKTFSECSPESDQIAEQHWHHEKELDFPRTLCFIWKQFIRYKSRYSKTSYLKRS